MEFTLEEIKEAFFNYFWQVNPREQQTEFEQFEKCLVAVSDRRQEWKTNFNIYLKLVNEAKIQILTTPELFNRPLKDWPNLNIKKSLERSIEYFWGTEAGWKLKIKQAKKVKKFNMVSTLLANIDKNKVFKSYQEELTYNIPRKHITPSVEI